jgi:hypothetical protein
VVNDVPCRSGNILPRFGAVRVRVRHASEACPDHLRWATASLHRHPRGARPGNWPAMRRCPTRCRCNSWPSCSLSNIPVPVPFPSWRGASSARGRDALRGGGKQRKIREVLLERPCYLMDGPGATIAAIDATVPDNDVDSNEERARSSRSQDRFEEAEPTIVAGRSLVPWSLPTASLSWAVSDVVTIVAVGL